jgi:hypothetical protein
VLKAWGPRYGRCRDCRQTTWYFTYKDFQPQGAGVAFRAAGAASYFTIWGPPGWHTNRGLKIGDPEIKIASTYGILPRVECGTYTAFVLRRGNVDTQFYSYKKEVWGFGISRAGAQPCH